MSLPDAHQLEVTLLGPGIGECAVIHIGDGSWIVVDSCIDEDGEPAALNYLRSLGVDFGSVKLVVATHWHDDHVGGLAALLRACVSAEFCVSGVLTSDEVLEVISAYNSRAVLPQNGYSEIWQAFHYFADLERYPLRAGADRRILQIAPNTTTHGQLVEVWSLSPCDAQASRFVRSLERLMPKPLESKRRVPRVSPNDCSVVILVVMGGRSILLGADLEEEGDANFGWSAILASRGRPQERRSSIFKIPHHGSRNGHHVGVWQHLLTDRPLAMLAPYRRSKLPTVEDVARIVGFSGSAYSTAGMMPKRARRFADRTVDGLVRASGVQVHSLPRRVGRITARAAGQELNEWAVETANGACSLDAAHRS